MENNYLFLCDSAVGAQGEHDPINIIGTSATKVKRKYCTRSTPEKEKIVSPPTCNFLFWFFIWFSNGILKTMFENFVSVKYGILRELV